MRKIIRRESERKIVWGKITSMAKGLLFTVVDDRRMKYVWKEKSE